MAKLAKRAKKEHSDNHEFLETEPKEIETLSLAQKKYLNVIKNNILTFATGCAGTGKAQPLDEPVLTPSGFVPMGDIEKGDFVVSEEGQPIRVLDTFINDNLKMYKLTFSDGSTTNCCEDHLWEIQTPKLASMKRYKVMPLSEMLDGINIDKSKKASYKYRVRLTKPVEFLKNDNQEIDAWTMGYILGNGSSTNYNLTITVGSHDFEEILSKIAPDVIMSYRRKVNGVYDIAVNKEHRHLYDLLGLHDVKSIDKWIPDNYKYGSIAQRKALLAGLLDSDGSCTNNKLRFSSSSKKLIDDVTWLVRSLGGIATITINDRTPSKNIEYCLQIRTPFNPFSLKRKAEGYKVLATDICANKRIVKAEYIGIQTGKCISVDSERHLYLTRDFTVTHNTYIALSYAAEQLKAKRISKIIITRPLVEAGEKVGTLPGFMDEKISPYFDPTIAILNKRLGQSYTEYLIKRNIIEAKPLAYLRGSTFENAMVILDESQNTTPAQMMMFLTRIGENCKMIVDGDLAQSDIRGESGLHDALTRLKQVNNVGHVHFTIDDVVRSGICKDILIAYGKPKPKLEDSE